MTAAQRRQALLAPTIALLASLLAFAATHYLSFMAALENIATDIRLASVPHEPQHPDIVIAAITEDTLAQFPYRSPVDREFLARLLHTLEQRGARAIVLDVLLDQPTEPAKDRALYDALRTVRVPLVVSYTATESVVNRAQQDYLDTFVPENLRGWANLATDPFDGVVRWMLPGEDDSRTPPSVPRKMAALLGVSTPRKQLDIAWRARPDGQTPAFAQYPAHALDILPAEWFKDRVVLIGATLSLTDRHRTPYAVVDDGDDGRMPGIVVQAHSLAQVLDERSGLRPPLAMRLGLIVWFALIGMGIGLQKRGLVFSLVCGAAVLGIYWVGAIVGARHGVPLVPLVAPTLAMALSLWMMDAIIGGAERRARQFVESAFSRYVSPAVVTQLLADPRALSIHGVRREATFIFTDISDFTTLSEKLDAETLSNTLNDYLDGACQIILASGGTIDKFMGDAIMAIFNAPIEQSDHVERGLSCAMQLDAYAQAFRRARIEQGIPLGQTRIGVHTGVATVGNFGSHQRMDFTALGDVVNTASRVEGANKYFGTRICCTQAVASQCQQAYFRPIGNVLLKGKQDTTALFEPVPAELADTPFMTDYRAAIEAVERGQLDARERLARLRQAYPEDGLIAFYASRIERGQWGCTVVLEDK